MHGLFPPIIAGMRAADCPELLGAQLLEQHLRKWSLRHRELVLTGRTIWLSKGREQVAPV